MTVAPFRQPLDAVRRRLGFANTSLVFLALGLAALACGDLAVTASHPGAEMLRLLRGLATPDVLAVDGRALADTVAFAVLGVGLGGTAGLALALVFPRYRAVRALCAFLRSIHELFWALLLMQVLALGPLTGVLAIALPYAGIFAKVFSEMIEEAEAPAARVLPAGTGAVSAFLFARLPDLVGPFGHYAMYRLECGLRSTLVLGFIGLPTIGFELDSYFKQGDFSQAAALLFCFYGLVATRRLWARPWTLLPLLAAAVLVLPAGLPAGPALANLARFARDVVPAPLRGGDPLSPAPWAASARWLGDILLHQALPGALRTLVLSQIALLGTAVLSLALFPLICRRFAGAAGRPVGRALLVVVRSTPDYMLAYVLLQTLGPSMLPAAIALTLHNGAVVGYLMGQQADALPLRPDAPARRTDLYFFEVLPRVYGQFLAYALYRWEIILRESAIFGLLGVATLGFYVDGAISELRLDVALVLIFATAGLSMAVDALSRALRRALRIDALPARVPAPPPADGR